MTTTGRGIDAPAQVPDAGAHAVESYGAAHYPDGVTPGEAELIATLTDVVAVLERAGIDHLLMGGIGSYTLARPRVTDDIDVFVRPGDVPALLDALAAADFETSMHDPSWLAKAFKRGVLCDIIFRSAGDIYLDDEMIRRGQEREYKGVPALVMAPEDLLVIKALATGEQTSHHWYDAMGIIARCPLDWEYVVRRAKESGPRRVLSLLLYAESCDLAVPSAPILALHDVLHGANGHVVEDRPT